MQTWEKNNSILTRVKQQNPSVYFNECQFHAVHNTSSAAAKAFNAGTGFDVDYLLVEIYYWSVHSTKRKCKLEEYTDFCEQGYRKIIKHVSTRWLSPLLDSRGSKPPSATPWQKYICYFCSRRSRSLLISTSFCKERNLLSVPSTHLWRGFLSTLPASSSFLGSLRRLHPSSSSLMLSNICQVSCVFFPFLNIFWYA